MIRLVEAVNYQSNLLKERADEHRISRLLTDRPVEWIRVVSLNIVLIPIAAYDIALL